MQAIFVKWALCLGALAILAGCLGFVAVLMRMRTRARWPMLLQMAFYNGGSIWVAVTGLGVVALTAGLAFLPARSLEKISYAYTPAQEVNDASSLAKFVTAAETEDPPAADPAADLMGSGGPEVTLNPSMNTQALQNALMQAPRGARVLFTAGTYSIGNTLTIPCNDLHITGPEAATPTALLDASFTNSDIFAYTSGCAVVGSIRYLHFANTGGVYLGGGNNSNFVFEHNLVTHLPSGLSNMGSESGVFFGGSLETVLSNIVIRHNTFGDAQSCTAVYATVKDEGGNCAGVLTAQGEVNNLRIEYNNFIHVEQGVHINQLAQWAPGKPNSICVSCVISYNYIVNYHRIGIEIQTSTPTDPIMIEHNAVIDPINSSWGTYAVSLACCQWSRTMGEFGNSPGDVFNDNVLVATLPIGSMCPPYGVEFWGNGAQGTNSLVQGKFCHGYTWGFGGTTWAVAHNYICGPDFVAKGGYITDQQHQGNPPKQTENLVGANCSATPSTAPAIAPVGGNFTGAQLVTLSDSGLNTGIWYTTDGSDPVPGAGTAKHYAGPFKVTTTTTVKAVGMWGAPNQPLKYPAGYGYVPSRVISAAFSAVSSVNQPQPRADTYSPAKRNANV